MDEPVSFWKTFSAKWSNFHRAFFYANVKYIQKHYNAINLKRIERDLNYRGNSLLQVDGPRFPRSFKIRKQPIAAAGYWIPTPLPPRLLRKKTGYIQCDHFPRPLSLIIRILPSFIAHSNRHNSSERLLFAVVGFVSGELSVVAHGWSFFSVSSVRSRRRVWRPFIDAVIRWPTMITSKQFRCWLIAIVPPWFHPELKRSTWGLSTT